MKPVDFEQSNLSMRPPEGWTEEQCGVLPVCHVRVPVEDSVVNGFVSCWQPTDQERADIAAGKPVWLTVLGEGQPPVNVGTECPIYPLVADPVQN